MTSLGPPQRSPVGSLVLAALLLAGAGLVGAGVLGESPDDSGRIAVTAPGLQAGGLPPGRRGPALPGAPGSAWSALDDGSPAVRNLDPHLLDALRRAVHDAAREGVQARVTSGWRSVEHQEQLLRDAVDEHGSQEEAARWVATPETSAHVSGDAVDLGPADAARWLSEHGSAYGLCQVYENEPWHFELRAEAVEDGCPAMYDDPTDDPRMQR